MSYCKVKYAKNGIKPLSTLVNCVMHILYFSRMTFSRIQKEKRIKRNRQDYYSN